MMLRSTVQHTILTHTISICCFYLMPHYIKGSTAGMKQQFQTATKRLNEGGYCGVWSDPDRSQLSGLLSLTLCLRFSSWSFFSFINRAASTDLSHPRRPAAWRRWGSGSEGNEHMLCFLFFWCHLGPPAGRHHRVNKALQVQQIHVTECVCGDFLLHVRMRWFLSESRQLLLLDQCVCWGCHRGLVCVCVCYSSYSSRR